MSAPDPAENTPELPAETTPDAPAEPAAPSEASAAPLGDPGVPAESTLPADPAEDPAQEIQEPIEVTIRRAPKVGRFMALGLLLGGVLSFILAVVSVGWSALSTTNTFWLTLLWTGPLGLALGALAAFILDRRSARRADERKAAREA